MSISQRELLQVSVLTSKEVKNGSQSVPKDLGASPENIGNMRILSQITGYLQYAYNKSLRPHLPRKLASLNGIPVRYVRLFDLTDVFPDYEGPLLDCIREYLSEDAEVRVIGGGYGVSAAAAARIVQPEGKVTVYEASTEQVGYIEETLNINGIEDIVEIQHAVVGNPQSVWGNFESAERIEPLDIPSCDTLILDCEGTEIQLLSNLEIRPQNIIVETHAYLDAPEVDVREILQEMGYELIDRRPEDEDRGIVILVGRYN